LAFADCLPLNVSLDSAQTVNYAHLLPTRYALELESLKGSVSSETFKEPTQREDAKKAIKKHFEERYARGANRWCESTLSRFVKCDTGQFG
jgi:ribosomal protein L14E/L6E/L27E